MADNTSLSAAKSATQYSDIEAEMNAYIEYNHDVFRDKTILLPTVKCSARPTIAQKETDNTTYGLKRRTL